MTWGAVLKELLTDPLAWAFAFIVGTLCAFGGYEYGLYREHQSNELSKQIAIASTYKENAKKEVIASFNVNEASKDHGNTIETNNSVSRNLDSDIGGLRLKSACPNLPTVAASSGKSSAGSASERTSAGEVDFTGIKREVIELGRDYDNAISQIEALNKIADEYRKTCNPD